MQRLAEERGSGDREEDVQDERGGDDDGLRLGKAVRVGALVGVRVRVRVRVRARVRARARVRVRVRAGVRARVRVRASGDQQRAPLWAWDTPG